MSSTNTRSGEMILAYDKLQDGLTTDRLFGSAVVIRIEHLDGDPIAGPFEFTGDRADALRDVLCTGIKHQLANRRDLIAGELRVIEQFMVDTAEVAKRKRGK